MTKSSQHESRLARSAIWSLKTMSLRRAVRADDFGALRLERRHPVVYRRGRIATGHAPDLEEVVNLRVSQLLEQIREELAAGLADTRIAQRPAQ